MKLYKIISSILFLFGILMFTNPTQAQQMMATETSLSQKEKNIIIIIHYFFQYFSKFISHILVVLVFPRQVFYNNALQFLYYREI